MTLQLSTVDNRLVNVSPTAYDRTWIDERTGYIYSEWGDENPQGLPEEEDFPLWLQEVIEDVWGVELHLHLSVFDRLEIDPDRSYCGPVRKDPATDLLFLYEGGLNGNITIEEGHVDRFFEQVFTMLFPRLHSLVLKDDTLAVIDEWTTTDWKYRLIDVMAFTPDDGLRRVGFDEIDWGETLRRMSEQEGLP